MRNLEVSWKAKHHHVIDGPGDVTRYTSIEITLGLRAYDEVVSPPFFRTVDSLPHQQASAACGNKGSKHVLHALSMVHASVTDDLSLADKLVMQAT